MATPEDVVGSIDFLCSPRAAFITGQELVVDGGLSLRWQGSMGPSPSRKKRRQN
jgi:NAD(P)-dependent dehydrogenase (short-subunit alcohol dehydrogenase family)